MDFRKQNEMGCLVDCLSWVRPRFNSQSERKESDSKKICLLKFRDYYGACISMSEGRCTCTKVQMWRSEDQLPKSVLSFLHGI